MIIGMLGGSFCPPTKAHLELSRKCIEEGLCDKVIWVPVNDAYKKDTNISSTYRVAMVALTLMNEKNIDYSLHEQKHKDIVRTIDSLKMLQDLYPDDKIMFIAGADKLKYKWIQREEMVRDFGLILTNRGDMNCEECIKNSDTLSRYRDNIKILNFDSDVSSTQVREDIQRKGTSDLVTPETLTYIQSHKLFKKDKNT